MGKINKIVSEMQKAWDKQLGYAILAFFITSAITSLPLIANAAWGYFTGVEWKDIWNAVFCNIDIFIIIVSIMASVIVIKRTSNNGNGFIKFIYGLLTGICCIIAVISLIVYCMKESTMMLNIAAIKEGATASDIEAMQESTTILDINRILKWAITSMCFAVVKVLICYFIPKKDR